MWMRSGSVELLEQVYAFNHFHLDSGEGLHLVIGVPNKRNDCVWLCEPIGLRLAQLMRCPKNKKYWEKEKSGDLILFWFLGDSFF